MIKAVRTESNQPVVIEEIQVFGVSVAVSNLVIHRGRSSQDRDGSGAGGSGGGDEARLIVSSQTEIVALKLQRCYGDKVTSCR